VEEDFDIASLASYLHLTPDQVRKMADRGKLPGRRVGGKWKFSSAEIHNWFEERIGLSDDKQLSRVEKVLEQQPESETITAEDIDITALVSPANIFVPLSARTKNSVIERICEACSQSGALWEPAKMADAIRSREELHPTALENGVALLHPRRPIPNIMGEPFVGLGITSSGIPFGGPRGVLTDIFFLIGSTSEPQHLRVLARLSRLIQQDDFLSSLRQSETADSAWQVIKDFDNEIIR
jgi:PTS system nitrogen regulatory IIA component